MNEPNAAQWLGAVGTAGALLIGVLVYWQGLRDRRREQARRINAWATKVGPKRDVTEMGVRVGMEGASVEVCVANNSHEPAYDFHVWVHRDLSPTSGSMGSHERPILPPGQHSIVVDGVDIPEGGLAHLPYVDVTFKDSAGRRWQRTYEGSLVRDRMSPHGRRAHWRHRARFVWRRIRRLSSGP